MLPPPRAPGGEVLTTVLGRTHPCAPRRTRRQRGRKPKGPLRVGRAGGKQRPHLVRQVCYQPALHQRTADDHAESERFGRLEERNELSAEPLRWVARGFWHSKTKWELNDAKVIPRSANVARERNQIRQAEVLPVVRRNAKPEPGRAAIASNRTRHRTFLEQLEGRAQPAAKCGLVDSKKLFFRIVEIVEIDAVEPEVLHAALELHHQEAGVNRVAATCQVVRGDETRHE